MAAGQNNVDYRSRLFKGCVWCKATQLLEDSSAVQMMCFYLLCLFVLGVSAGTSEVINGKENTVASLLLLHDVYYFILNGEIWFTN